MNPDNLQGFKNFEIPKPPQNPIQNSPPPPNPYQSQETPSPSPSPPFSFQGQGQGQGQGQNVSPDNLFADFNVNQKQPYNRGEPKEPNEPSEPNEPIQYDNPHPTPEFQVNGNVLTVAGVVGLIIVLSLVISLSVKKYRKYRDDKEYRIKSNYNQRVAEEQDNISYEEVNDNNWFKAGLSEGTEVVTKIAKYIKVVQEDGRTSLKVSIDNYGEYVIYVPNLMFETLEDEGYIIVDLEIVKNDVGYVCISEKQENFKNILENE